MSATLYDPNDPSTHPFDGQICGLIFDPNGFFCADYPPQPADILIATFRQSTPCWEDADDERIFPPLYFVLAPAAIVYWFPIPALPDRPQSIVQSITKYFGYEPREKP